MAGIRKPSPSPQTKEAVLRDYYDLKLSFYALGKKYGISDHTAKRIIESHPRGFKAPVTQTWEPLENRSELRASQRSEKLKQDSLMVIELSVQAMLRNLTIHPESLNPSQLTAFINAASDFALAGMEENKLQEQFRKKFNSMFKSDYDPAAVQSLMKQKNELLSNLRQP